MTVRGRAIATSLDLEAWRGRFESDPFAESPRPPAPPAVASPANNAEVDSSIPDIFIRSELP